MKKSLLLMIAMFSPLGSACFGADHQLEITARVQVYESGTWRMSIKEYGVNGGARFSYGVRPRYIRDPNPKVVGYGKTKTLSKGQIELIERTIKESKFFSVKKVVDGKVNIAHPPLFGLTVCLDESCHSVSLKNIRSGSKSVVEAKGFIIVWNLLWGFTEGVRYDSPKKLLAHMLPKQDGIQ